MASLDVIRTLTLRAKAEGFPQAGQAVSALGEMYETSARKQASMEKTLEGLERRFITSVRQTQDFQKTQEQLNRITAAFPQLQERANAVLGEAAARFGQVQSVSGTVAAQFGKVTSQLAIMQPAVQGTLTGFTNLQGMMSGVQNVSGATTARLATFSNTLNVIQGGVTTTAATLGTLGNQFGALTARVGLGGTGAGAGAAGQMLQFGNQSKAARYELINLSRQIQDVGVSLASGQNPFTVLIQQGSQIADVFASSQLTMAQWAQRFLTFFTPARLIILGFTAAVGALAFTFIKLAESVVTTEKILKDQGNTLEQLRKAYGDATSSAGSFLEVSREILSLEIARGIRESQEQIERLSESFRKLTATPVAVPLDVLLPPGFENIPQILETTSTGFVQLDAVINRFNQSAKGWQDVKRMRDELAAIDNATRATNPALAQQALRYFDLTKELGNVAEAMRKYEAAQRINRGEAEKTDRTTVGLSETLRQLPFDQLVKRTQEQIELRELETVSIGKTDAEIKKLKLQFDAERAAREGLTSEQQHTIDLLKLEIEIAELNNEARKKAIDLLDKERRERERIGQSFDQFLTSTKNSIELRKLETENIGKSEAAVKAAKIQFDAERISKGNLTEARQKEVDALKAEAIATENSFKARSDSIALTKKQTDEAERLAKRLQDLRDTLKAERETLFFSDEDVKIIEKLRELMPGLSIEEILNTNEAAMIRFNTRVKEARDLTADFLNTFISGLVEGKSVTDALAKSVQSLGAAITQAATKQIGTSIIGAPGVGEAAGTGLTGLLGAGGLGLSGLGLGAATGGAGIAIGVGLSLLGKLLEDNEQEAQAAAQAAEQFNNQLQQSRESLNSMVNSLEALNNVSGDVTTSIKNAALQLDQINKAALAQIQIAKTQGGVTIAAPEAKKAADEATLAMEKAAQQFKMFSERTIENAREALRGADALSETAQRMADLEAQAKDLQEAMVALGVSGIQASEIVAEDLAKGLDRLRQQIETDLIRSINELQGTGWINQLTDMFESIADAQKLGVDPQVINKFMALQAQQIVNQNEIMGESFQQLLQLFPQLNGVIHEFGEAVEQTVDVVMRSAGDLARAQESLQDRMLAAQTDTSTLEGQLLIFDRQAQREREAEIRAGGENIALLEQTLALERLRIVRDFNDQMIEEQQRAQESLQDRILAARTDTSTLEGQLAIFDRQAQREREAEIRAGGKNLALLEETLAAERLRIVEDFNKQLLEEERRAAEDRQNTINAAAKNVVDYVNSLLAGSQATGSPRSRLEAARSTYEKTLELARQGNINAVNRIAQDAEALRTALRDVYGSTSRYQEGLQQITTDLLTLPTVESSTDQIVNAIRDSIIVLKNINAQLSGGIETFPATESGLGLLAVQGFQYGGWVKGGAMTQDNQPVMASAGEFMVRRSVALANASWLPQFNRSGTIPGNDNTVEELRLLRRENAFMLTQLSKLVAQGNTDNVTAIRDQQRSVNAETRLQATRVQARQRKRESVG